MDDANTYGGGERACNEAGLLIGGWPAYEGCYNRARLL
jgi:hypothetical protein